MMKPHKTPNGREIGRLAYHPVWTGKGWGLGVAEENEPGYSPVNNFEPATEEAAGVEADRRNAEMGLTIEDAAKIVMTSMRKPYRGKPRRR